MVKRFSHKLYGLVGNPVAHSLSPNMHNAAFKKLNINAVYLPFPVKKGKLKHALSFLRETGVAGFNVTIPFKSECMRYLDKIDPLAKKIGAVNTVLAQKKSLIGKNTDYSGFLRSLSIDLRFNPKDKSIFLIGAGGVSRAVAFALAGKGCKDIFIYDIASEKASSLSGAVNRAFKRVRVSSCGKKDIPAVIRNCRLLVNCTPLGMKKGDPLPIEASLLHKGLKVYDVIYRPSQTKLLKECEKRSIKSAGGTGMLLYQGVMAFELWTGRKAPVALMKKELLGGLS